MPRQIESSAFPFQSAFVSLAQLRDYRGNRGIAIQGNLNPVPAGLTEHIREQAVFPCYLLDS